MEQHLHASPLSCRVSRWLVHHGRIWWVGLWCIPHGSSYNGTYTHPLHITIKELLSIVMAVATWGNKWASLTIQANCDNMAVVQVLRSHQSKDLTVMHLLRCLALLKCSFQFSLTSKHIPGKTQFASTRTVQKQPLILSFQLPTGQSFTYSPSTTPLLNSCAAETRLDLRQLGESVREYYIRGLAPSTVKSYASAKSRFVQFCHNINQSCIPVSETLLCLYVWHLANENVSASSIKSYLSAIRHLQIILL